MSTLHDQGKAGLNMKLTQNISLCVLPIYVDVCFPAQEEAS